MKRVHLFNPENDIALAAAMSNFTPPRAALDLRQAGEMLPLWYADDNDLILSNGVNASWLERIQNQFGITADVYNRYPTSDLQAAPWGWSLAARKSFLDEGFMADILPSDSKLETYRRLSHRRTAAVVAQRLNDVLGFKIAAPALEFDDIGQLKDYVYGNRSLVIKSPWSSSGRGVFFTEKLTPEEVLRRCEGIIRRQGSVMVEHAYRRINDFAMLFEIRQHKASFVGYSVFSTADDGTYCGNMLADDDTLSRHLAKLYPSAQLLGVREALVAALDEFISSFYDGPVGVDMLFYINENGEVELDAVVEINLRMTMGFVAHSLSERFLYPGSVGRYYLTRHNTMDSDSVEIADHRLVSGRINLTPPGAQFCFLFEAQKQ